MKAKLIEIREALEGVIRVADRATIEFDAAKAAVKTVDELLAELESPVENHSPTPWRFHKPHIIDCNGCWVVVDIDACKVNINHIIKCVNAQAAINAIKG